MRAVSYTIGIDDIHTKVLHLKHMHDNRMSIYIYIFAIFCRH
jgi:hypothetical protein